MKQAPEYCVLCETGGREPLVEKDSCETRDAKPADWVFSRDLSANYIRDITWP
jgi:hypothetical protein